MFHRYLTLEGAFPPGLDTNNPSSPRPFFLPIDLVSTVSGGELGPPPHPPPNPGLPLGYWQSNNSSNSLRDPKENVGSTV